MNLIFLLDSYQHKRESRFFISGWYDKPIFFPYHNASRVHAAAVHAIFIGQNFKANHILRESNVTFKSDRRELKCTIDKKRIKNVLATYIIEWSSENKVGNVIPTPGFGVMLGVYVRSACWSLLCEWRRLRLKRNYSHINMAERTPCLNIGACTRFFSAQIQPVQSTGHWIYDAISGIAKLKTKARCLSGVRLASSGDGRWVWPIGLLLLKSTFVSNARRRTSPNPCTATLVENNHSSD